MPRVAIVTGGSGALGQAITLRLRADGLSVAVPWIVDKERDRLESRVPVDTPANRAAMPDADPSKWTPVESVAAEIAFLVREDTTHVTGTLVSV